MCIYIYSGSMYTHIHIFTPQRMILMILKIGSESFCWSSPQGPSVEMFPDVTISTSSLEGLLFGKIGNKEKTCRFTAHHTAACVFNLVIFLCCEHGGNVACQTTR